MKQKFARDETLPSSPKGGAACTTHEETRNYLRMSLDFLRSMPPSVDMTQGMLNLAWISLGEDCEAEAELLLRESAPMVGSMPALLPDYLRVAGAFVLRQGDLFLARRTFTMIQMTPDADSSAMAYSWEGLAMVAALMGEAEASVSLATRAAERRGATGMEVAPWWRRQLDAAMAEVAKKPAPEMKSATEIRSTATRGPSTTPFRTVRVTDGPVDVGGAPFRHITERAQKAEPTPRERAVADLVAQGMSNRQIARQLKLSERTVESHLAKLRTKLHLQSRAQVAIWAARCTVCVRQRPARSDSVGGAWV